MVYRTPTDSNWRSQWGLALSNEVRSNGFLVCVNHFQTTDYRINKNGDAKLNALAVPSIFAKQPGEDIANVGDAQCEPCEQCSAFEEEVLTLKKENDDMRQQIHMQAVQIADQTTELNRLRGADLVKFVSDSKTPKVLNVFCGVLFKICSKSG